MDSALHENPDDEDLLHSVQNCKAIQLSLCEEDKYHIQPTPHDKVSGLNLSKLSAQQQLPTLELPQTMPESRFETRERVSSRQYYVANPERQFSYKTQVVMPTQGRRNSWMCLTEFPTPAPNVAVEASEVHFENYYNAPYFNHTSEGKSDAVDYYADLGFDLSFTKQSYSAPQYQYYY